MFHVKQRREIPAAVFCYSSQISEIVVIPICDIPFVIPKLEIDITGKANIDSPAFSTVNLTGVLPLPLSLYPRSITILLPLVELMLMPSFVTPSAL